MSLVSRDELVLRPRHACLGFLAIDHDLINTSGGQAGRSSNPRDGVGTRDSLNSGLLAVQIVAGFAAGGADPVMADDASDAAVEGPRGRFVNRPSCEGTAKAIAAWTQRGAESSMLNEA